MILSDVSIKENLKNGLLRIDPFVQTKQTIVRNEAVPSFGLSHAGYDMRISENIQRQFENKFFDFDVLNDEIFIQPGEIILAATVERIALPNNMIATIDNKSTWTRQGIQILGAPVEPGWDGVLTLTIKNNSANTVRIPIGCGIAQIIFHTLTRPCEHDYSKGKYQGAKGLQRAKL